MRHRLLLVLVAVTALVLVGLVLSNHEPVRSWRIAQTKPLADGISMRVENLFLFPSGTNTFLRFRCRYLGGEPVNRLSLRASMLYASPPPGMDRIPTWQVGVPDDGQGGIPRIWEFRINPHQKSSRVILRIYWHRQMGDTTEHFVDFSVPYLPKMTKGEVDA
jgi:hypothetical protein